MSTFLDRVRIALLPEYEVAREIGQGGMGQVFLARDLTLDCNVAIKVLAQHLATEVAVARFRKEAQVLANLRHDRIVAVHKFVEADGLFFFVMDYLEDGTLQQQLVNGPMPVWRVRKLGDHLLRALAAVHARNLVHRDIKPANIFLADGGFKLADFGIVLGELREDDTRDSYGGGTPRYMAPEAFVGPDVTNVADLYAVGVVLWEAFTGNEWTPTCPPSEASWKGVPRGYRPCLRRALAVAPDRRWQTAQEYRKAWLAVWSRVKLAGMVTALTLAVAVGTVVASGRAPAGTAGPLQVAVLAPALQGEAPDPEFTPLAVRARMSDGLQARPDVDACACDDGDLSLQPTLVFIDSLVRVTVRARNPGIAVHAVAERPGEEWRAAVDEAVAGTMRDIWETHAAFARWLPNEALPSDPGSMSLFLNAEDAWFGGRWDDAVTSYNAAIEIDSSCVICSWRITEAQRWLMVPPSAVHLERTIEARDVFPTHYQNLIHARRLPVDERLALLRETVEAQPDFYLASFALGDEWSHRGVLAGESPWEALEYLDDAGDFAPALEHQAWVAITMGNRVTAEQSLGRAVAKAGGAFRSPIVAMLTLAFGYRFDEAASGDPNLPPDVMSMETAAAGPRLLLAFGAPRGAIHLGELFEATGDAQLAFSGAFAQYLGYHAVGQPTRARTVADRIRAMEYHAAAFETFDAALTELAERFHRDALAPLFPDSPVRFVGSGNAAAQHLDSVLVLVANGDVSRPIQSTEALRVAERSWTTIDLDDSVRRLGDALKAEPFLSAWLHLLRASWFYHDGAAEEALHELLWHYGFDPGQLPDGAPVAQDANWVLTPLARWLTARIIDDGTQPSSGACAAYADVARYWMDGEGVFQTRAEYALRRSAEIGCETGDDR